METNKNLCALIPLSLHNRVREEQEKSGQTLSAYITNVLTSYYEREENAIKISDKRTLALRGYPTGCERVLPASTAANLFP